MLHFERHCNGRVDRIAIQPDSLVVAGWTGRDMAAIQHHIDELGAIGVPAPSKVPLFYRLSVTLLTQVARIQVLGPDTSGEVEPVIVALADGLWVGVGSDHTDRKAEAIGVALSKQLCPKAVGTALWRYDEVRPHWDRLVLRAWAVVDGARVAYQEGAVAGIRTPQELVEMYRGNGGGAQDDTAGLAPGCIMFCGTLAAIGGVRPATRFEMELEDPVLGRRLRHAYDVEALPVVS